MSKQTYPVDIAGYHVELPVLPIDNDLSIAFFNLHGAQALTEHCGKELAKLVEGADVVITAESKGLQLAHCVARNLGQEFYAVARKTKKLYMQDGIEVTVKSITTKNVQTLYLSEHDTELIRGKKSRHRRRCDFDGRKSAGAGSVGRQSGRHGVCQSVRACRRRCRRS